MQKKIDRVEEEKNSLLDHIEKQNQEKKESTDLLE